MQLGGRPDPVTAKSTPRFEAAVVRLQQAAYVRTLRLVQARRQAVGALSSLCCHALGLLAAECNSFPVHQQWFNMEEPACSVY